MSDPRGGVTGRLDHRVDRAVLARFATVLGKARPPDTFVVPTHGAAGFFRSLRIEVCDHRHVEARNRRDLRQEHGAEFPGADQCDADRHPGFATGGKKIHEVHRAGLDRR